MAKNRPPKGPAKEAKAEASTTEAQVETTPKAEEGSPTPAAPVKKEKVMPTLEQALASAKEKDPARYGHVVRVVELTKEGNPKRVVITCQDPQIKQEGDKAISVCIKEREIAVQDLFQVRRCEPCADRVVKRARRRRMKDKMKALKQQDAARKQG